MYRVATRCRERTNTPHLTVAALARNEAGRFLPDALSIWKRFADATVVLDDNSTDNTADLARDSGAYVYSPTSALLNHTGVAWGNESGYRQLLWTLAMESTPDDGWVLFLDADMIPARNPRELMQGSSDAWAFVLFDLWEDRNGKFYYREDKYWQGHNHPRIWMVKKQSRKDWTWNDRGIHCGHLPSNFSLQKGAGIAPYDMGLLHFAYVTPALRNAKRAQYGDVSSISTSHEQRHAASIIDPNPRILPLSFTPEFRIGLPEVRSAA